MSSIAAGDAIGQFALLYPSRFIASISSAHAPKKICQFALFRFGILSVSTPGGVDLPTRLKKEQAYYELIKELVRRRKRAGITQGKVARVIKTDQSQISKYERVERELGIVDFVRYCKAIGTDPRELLRLIEK